MSLPENHPVIPAPKIGVLLLNLGTPDGCDTRSVRRYLAEFLSDSRVIDAPRWFWLPLLHGIILNTRPRKSARAYRAIWNHDVNESPLKTITRAQCDAVRARFSHEQNIVVDWAMRYGNPSTRSAIERLCEAGCTRILCVALYPHYSASTTASSYDEVFRVLSTLKRQPAVRTAPAYHDDPLYIGALANSVTTALQNIPRPDAFIASFHGLPERYFREGDPYHCYCQKTSRLLREQLGIPKEQWHTSFQSRFGPTEWLKPYTQATVEQLARDGHKHLAIISPGFAADCIETLEEIAMGLRETFLHAGGERFTYIPCLNATEPHIALIESLVRRGIAGW